LEAFPSPFKGGRSKKEIFKYPISNKECPISKQRSVQNKV
jgi:hypothetical protein